MVIVSFELGVGNADRPGSLGSHSLCRPGRESRQPGRDGENFTRGLLRVLPPPGLCPAARRQDGSRRAVLQLRIAQAER